MNSISRVRDCDNILQYPWLFYNECGYSTATLLHEKVETFSIEVGFDPGGSSEVETELPLVIPSTDTNRCCLEKSDTVLEESIPTRSSSILKSNSSDFLNWDIPYLAEEFPNQSNCSSQKNDWNSQLIRDDPYLFSVSDIGDTDLRSINSSSSAQEPKFVDPSEIEQGKNSKSFCTSKDFSESEIPLQINSVINLKSVSGLLPGMIVKDTGINEAWKNDFSQSKVMLYEFLEIEELNNSVHYEDSLNSSQDDANDNDFMKTDNKIEDHQPQVKENIDEYLNKLSADNDAKRMINFTKYQEYKILSRNENSTFSLSHKQNNFYHTNTNSKNNKTEVKTAFPKCQSKREKGVRKRKQSDEIGRHYNTRKSERDTNFMLGLKSGVDEKKDKENFINHNQMYLKDKSLINSNLHECSFCGKVYSSAKWFKKHKSSHLCQANNAQYNLNFEKNELSSAEKASSKIKDCSIVVTPLKKIHEGDHLNAEVKGSSTDDSWLNELICPSVENQNILSSHNETKTSENVKNNKINDDVLKKLKSTCSYSDGKVNSQINKSSTSVFFHDDNVIDNKSEPKCISQNIKHYNTRSYSKIVSTPTSKKKIKRKYEITSVKKSCVMSRLPLSDLTCLSEDGFIQSENCSVAEKIEHSKKCEDKQYEKCNSKSDSVSRKRKISAAVDVFLQPVVKLRRLDPEFLKNVLPSFQLPEIEKSKKNSAATQNSYNVPKDDYYKKNSVPYFGLPGYSCHKNFFKQSSYSGKYRNLLDLDIVHSYEKGASELRTVDVKDSFNEKLKGLQLNERVKDLRNYKENTLNSDYKVSGVGNKTIVTRSKSKKIKLQVNESKCSENSVDCVSGIREEIPLSQVTIETRVHCAESTYIPKSSRSLSSNASRSPISTDIPVACSRKTKKMLCKMTSQDHKSSLLHASSANGSLTNECHICDNSQLKPTLPLYEKVANLNPQEKLEFKSCGKMCESQCARLRSSLTRKKCNRIKEHTSKEVNCTKSGTFISSVENSVDKADAMNLDFSFVTSAETVIMKGRNRIEAESVLYASEKENKINSSVIETLTTKKHGNSFQGGGSFRNKDRNWRENNTLIKTFKINRKKSAFCNDKIPAMQNNNSLKSIANNDDAMNCNSLKNSSVIESKVTNSFKSKELLDTSSETLKTNSEGQSEKSYFLRFKKENITNQSKCLKTKNYDYSKCTESNLRSKVSIPNETSTLALECAVEFPNNSDFSCNASTKNSIFQKNINLKQDVMGIANACYSSSVTSELNGRFMVEQKSCDISVKRLVRKFKNCDHLKTVNGLVIFDKTPVVKIERLNL